MSRSTMADLIQEVRVRTQENDSGYNVLSTVQYWDDDQIQNVLDRHRQEIWRYAIPPVQTYSGGTVIYRDYPLPVKYLETTDGGTATFYLETGAGVAIGTANYTPDYNRGYITFSADQSGSTYYLYARAYDPDGAAAEIWRHKAGRYATAVDFSTDNHSISRSKIIDNCFKMAQFYEARSLGGGFSVMTLTRSDVNTVY